MHIAQGFWNGVLLLIILSDLKMFICLDEDKNLSSGMNILLLLCH